MSLEEETSAKIFIWSLEDLNIILASGPGVSYNHGLARDRMGHGNKSDEKVM